MVPRTLFAVCIALTALVGCLGGSATSCGPNMRFEQALGVCVCNDNAIADGGGCTACASDEVVVGLACACAPGQVKQDNDICAPAPGLGALCDAATPCTASTYNFCASYNGEPAACTKRCAVDTDCPDAYVCAVWEAEPSCRTYTGYGETCTQSDECASYDAKQCLQGHCAVTGCTLGVNECPRDTKCCDFSSFGLGTVCAPAGYCP